MSRGRTYWMAGAGLTLLVGGLMASSCLAGAKVTVGRIWPASDQISIDQINHAPWDGLLKKYVDDQGYVDYAAWKASAADTAALDGYLNGLSRANPQMAASREAKLAFWINAYNAVTIKGILREYPTTSIRNHTAKVIGYNIWDDLLLTVGENAYSLNQMEHEILRKMGEPRIHFAIVCASVGCPRLLNEAYTADKLDAQLTTNARAFFADPEKFQYDASSGRIEVSPILKWFAEDFGANASLQMRTIASYLPDAGATKLAQSGSARVSYLDYDWDLNDQAKRRATARRR